MGLMRVPFQAFRGPQDMSISISDLSPSLSAEQSRRSERRALATGVTMFGFVNKSCDEKFVFYLIPCL